MPFSISPSVSTLRYRSSSRCSASQAATAIEGRGLVNSDTTHVSSRYSTGGRSGRCRGRGRGRGGRRAGANGRRTRGAAAGPGEPAVGVDRHHDDGVRAVAGDDLRPLAQGRVHQFAEAVLRLLQLPAIAHGRLPGIIQSRQSTQILRSFVSPGQRHRAAGGCRPRARAARIRSRRTAAALLRAGLTEPGFREMAVEREGAGNPAPAHHVEARPHRQGSGRAGSPR